MLPLRMGSADHFFVLRNFLERQSYTEAAVCARLGLDRLHQLSRRKTEPLPAGPAQFQDTLDALIKVLLEGSGATRAGLGAFIPAPIWAALEALGILRAHDTREDFYYSSVALYPLDGLYFVSDRRRNADGTPLTVGKNFVFPAMHHLAQQYLALLPAAPCEKLLDLCSGTAVAALVASTRYAQRVWAVELNERAARFGEFNRRLNWVSNATVLQGDLYAPVRGLKFHRIVAHPPYVPSRKPRPLYADGGEDGEFVTRAIVQNLPQFLEPCGRFYCMAMGLDRDGETYQERVRGWLGAEQSAFDVMFLEAKTYGPLQYSFHTTKNVRGSWDEMEEWRAHLEKLKVTKLAHGLLVIQARESRRRVFTVRRHRGESFTTAEVERLRNWETGWASRTSDELILASCPRLAAGITLDVVHAEQNGKLVPTDYILRTAHPFQAEYPCPAWVFTLINHCDGHSTVLELYEAGMREGRIPADLPREKFVGTVAELVSHAILEIAG